MSRALIPAALCGLLCLTSVSPAGKPIKQKKGNWTRCKEAKYSAHQIDRFVVVVGFGIHRTGGYKTKFRQLPQKIFPPQFEFLHQKPTGIVTQVLTPFSELTYFRAAGKVKSVVIFDGNGRHTVPVRQTKGK